MTLHETTANRPKTPPLLLQTLPSDPDETGITVVESVN